MSVAAEPSDAAPERADADAARGRAEALSALIEELARAPERDLREAWERGHEPGERIGRFELVRELGRGGFGVVFEALDLDLGRGVAFKALRAGSRARDPAREALLRREAEAVAQLSHPNIVTLHDLGRCDSGPYLILELLRGETLARRLARGPLPARDAVRIGAGVARALAHAHAHGVLHRDLKPGNVFLCEDGAVKVLDFGLAHVLGAGGPAGSGTPGYMAPEQVRGAGEDPRTDVFALGVLLHEMLAGARPDSASEVPLPAGTPAGLRALVARAQDPDPARRPASAAQALEALEAVARLLDPPQRRPGRRRRLALTITIAAALAAAAGFWLGRGGPAVPPPVQVALADAVNGTGDPELDAVSGMLADALAPSRRVAVVPRARLLDLVTGAGGRPARLSPDLAREAARAAAVRALLVPAVRSDAQGYDLALSAIDPADGAALFEVHARAASRSGLPEAVDRLAAAARRGLSEAEGDVSAGGSRVGEAFTADLEAYRQYFLGEQCAARPVYGQDCSTFFRRAVARDPRFAAAHYQLAVWDAWGGDRAAQRDAFRRAQESAARATERDRLHIRAWAAHLEGDDDASVARYREAAERWPEDRHAVYMIGDLLRHQDRFAEAVPWLERAALLDPEFGWAPGLLAECLGASGQVEALRAWIARWEASPRPAALHALSVAYGWTGDVAAAQAAARRGLALGGGLVAQEDLATARLFAGETGEAERELRALAGPGSEVPVVGQYGLSVVTAYAGRMQDARAVLDALGAARPALERDAVYLALRADLAAGDADPAALRASVEALGRVDALEAAQHAAVLAWRGDVEGAAALARALPAGVRERTWRGVAAVRRGEVDAGLDLLRGVVHDAPADVWRVAPLFLYGDLAAAAGRDAEAVDALERFERLYLARTMWRGWALPRARLVRAGALARLGRTEEARALLDATLPALARADADFPILADARTLRASLARR